MITGHGKRPGPENPVDVVLNKPIDLDQLTAMAKLVSEARKSLAAQTSLTTASCQNKEIHSCAARRSSFDPPFNSTLPSRYLINWASPQPATTSPSSLNVGKNFI